MKFRLKIDYRETGKQCAAISTALVLSVLVQLLLEPQKARPLLSVLGVLAGLVWYALAQYCFTHKSKDN